MSNSKDFKVKNGIQPTVYNEGVGTVVSGTSGYSLGNASYDSVSLSVTSQIGTPTGIFFKPDGTKVFIVDLTGQDISEYSLSTAWDLTTASYTTAFSISSQDTNPWGIFFKPDGTVMYLMGRINDTVFQYTLSTAWDISTASYASKSFSATSQDTLPNDLFLKSDGTKMYVLGGTNDTMYQYTLSTAYDISTASYDSVSFSVASQSTATLGVFFHPDGTSFYVVASNRVVYKYDLSTTWDLSTASYSGTSATWSDPTDTATYQVFFKSDGTKMYIVGGNTDSVYQFSTVQTTATLDLSTGSVFEITPTSDIQIGLSNPAASGTVSAATLLLDGGGTTGYDLGNASYTNKSYTITEESQPYAMFFKSDGTKMYAVGIINDTVYQYSLSTAWDVSTASYDSVSFSVSLQSSDPNGGLVFSPDGTKMYVGSQTGSDSIYQYTLSTAWDLSTASYASKSFSVSTQVTSLNSFRLNSDGTKMFALNGGDDTIYQYTLSTAYDISSASYASLTYAITEDTIPRAFDFNNDGTQLIVVGATNDDVFQYTLSTAYTINTASYDNVSLDGSTQFGNPHDVLYSGDGKNLYVLDLNTDTVLQYSTATPATITYDTTLEFAGGTAPTSPAIGETDVIAISTRDGGTTYQAVQAIDGAK